MADVTVESVRHTLTEVINDIKTLEGSAKPPVVQELVIARRSAEDSRMRLGVAHTLDAGKDPWSSAKPKAAPAAPAAPADPATSAPADAAAPSGDSAAPADATPPAAPASGDGSAAASSATDSPANAEAPAS